MDTIINPWSQRPAACHATHRIALNRCTKAEAHWNRNPVSLDSPVLLLLFNFNTKQSLARQLNKTMTQWSDDNSSR